MLKASHLLIFPMILFCTAIRSSRRDNKAVILIVHILKEYQCVFYQNYEGD